MTGFTIALIALLVGMIIAYGVEARNMIELKRRIELFYEDWESKVEENASLKVEINELKSKNQRLNVQVISLGKELDKAELSNEELQMANDHLFHSGRELTGRIEELESERFKIEVNAAFDTINQKQEQAKAVFKECNETVWAAKGSEKHKTADYRRKRTTRKKASA